MSGSPDWKPGHQVRPSSSASNWKFSNAAQSSVKVSPSSIDMSGRFARDQSRKRPLSDITDDDPDDRRVRPRTAIFGGDEKVYIRATPSHTAKTAPPSTPFVSPCSIFGKPEVLKLMELGRGQLPPRQFSYGGGPPFVPEPQAMWPGGMLSPGWHIGAFFRCILRPGLHNRVYEGPPDGTPRVRLGPEEINVDFTRPYKIRALFCNHTFSAVQFKAPAALTMNGFIKPGMMVWTNVRRGHDWWARLVHTSLIDDPAADDEESGEGSAIIRDVRRPVSTPRFAPTVPAWNELDHGDFDDNVGQP